MRSGNKALRDHAQPFISESFSGGDYEDYYLQNPQYNTSLCKAIPVQMTRPEKADIIEAYLFMEMKAPTDQGLSVRVGIGTFAGDANETNPTLEYSEEYLAEQHRKITGTDSPFSVAANGTLTIDADLTRSIPKRGDANFISDTFILLVSFASLPSSDNGYVLNKFKLSCTAQMGLGT